MNLLRALEPFVSTRHDRRAGERCDLCSAPVGPDHPHLADVERRALACACRACAMLFTRTGDSASGRWRTVPERHLFDPMFAFTDADWDALGIPVSMAFFFKSSSSGTDGWTAVYPSPAGPVESLLSLEAWAALASQTVLVDTIEPDVEALLVATDGGGSYTCMLVPIHACYALVGHVRKKWRGLDGGEEAHASIDEHLATLMARCETVGRRS
ncbi:MAG: hypothetical protein JWM74_2916 [Myxococcaceae bacterium]|nr:hypothetical protein [Myxococcaceae bacterium]